jgi:hypothetical protein
MQKDLEFLPIIGFYVVSGVLEFLITPVKFPRKKENEIS